MYKQDGFWEKVKTYLMFAGPTTFAFLSVIVIPFIFGLYLTFTNYSGFSAEINFIGLENYRAMLQDEQFVQSFFLTLKYVLYTVVLVNLLAFTLGYLLTRGNKGENIFRAGFFVPNLI